MKVQNDAIAQHKRTFIENEIWLLTIGGAFQHVRIYKNDASGKNKREFRKKLRERIETIGQRYSEVVSEEDHLENISSVRVEDDDGVQEKPLEFGVQQKLLNLYLKYHWVHNIIKNAPPHFPVDRIIQDEIHEKKNHKISWSTMDKKKYLEIIEKARGRAKTKSLAEWELENFKRRFQE